MAKPRGESCGPGQGAQVPQTKSLPESSPFGVATYSVVLFFNKYYWLSCNRVNCRLGHDLKEGASTHALGPSTGIVFLLLNSKKHLLAEEAFFPLPQQLPREAASLRSPPPTACPRWHVSAGPSQPPSFVSPTFDVTSLCPPHPLSFLPGFTSRVLCVPSSFLSHRAPCSLPFVTSVCVPPSVSFVSPCFISPMSGTMWPCSPCPLVTSVSPHPCTLRPTHPSVPHCLYPPPRRSCPPYPAPCGPAARVPL